MCNPRMVSASIMWFTRRLRTTHRIYGKPLTGSYLRFSLRLRVEGTDRQENTDKQSYKRAADCAVQPVE